MGTSTMGATLGLDIGGANLKAAHSAGVAHTRAFPLWRLPGRLADELRGIRAQMPSHQMLAVTMTGELCDCFASKRDGVLAILHAVEEAAAGSPVCIWTTRSKFLTPRQVGDDPLTAAAANWLALAHLAARFSERRPALLIDAGSTTTDLIFLDKGQPRPRCFTDRTRLASGELIYTGLRRTPICAVLGMGVAAEIFATMLDAYLVRGLVPEQPCETDTADGRPATRDAACARLARMLCADVSELPLGDIDALAHRAIDTQTEYICRAIDQVLGGIDPPERVVLSGSGEAIGQAAAARHATLRALPITSLAQCLGSELSEAACAYAVALLAVDQCIPSS